MNCPMEGAIVEFLMATTLVVIAIFWVDSWILRVFMSCVAGIGFAFAKILYDNSKEVA